MGGKDQFRDKIEHKGQELKGEAKERIGDLTDNEQLQAEGKKDKVMGDLKQAGDKVQDAFR